MNSFAIICYLFDIMVSSNVFYLILIISFEIFYLEILVYLFTFHLFQQGILYCRYSTIPTIICTKSNQKLSALFEHEKKFFLKNFTCSMQRKYFLLNLAREIPALELCYQDYYSKIIYLIRNIMRISINVF